jgi:two-component system, sensor histidine kinase YesM
LLSGDDSFLYREAHAYIQSLVGGEQGNRVYRWTVTTFGDQAILLLFYKYRNAYYGAWINLQSLIRNLELDDSREANLLFFADDSGSVGTGDPSLLETDFLSTSANLVYQDQNYISVIGESSQSDLILVEFLSKGRMAASLPAWLRTLQIISLLALLIIPIMLLFLRRWIIHPIRSLTRAMAEIEKGNLDYRIVEQAHGSEFDQINRNFNQMMDQVKDLKIDVYENKLEKQNIKMRYLAQQIQPHFILNAMNILYSYEPEEYPLIRKMIQCLAKYFRYIVKVDANFVRIDQELAHIRNYFEIQKARYPDTFFASVDCDPDVASCLVPPLIVQNFAENAIKHSLVIGNKIDIMVKAEKLGEDKVHILISDTGEGIPQEVLDKIELFRATRQYQDGLGIGIQNSIERLDILYEGKTELKFVRHEDPCGTKVEIVVPRHEDPTE